MRAFGATPSLRPSRKGAKHGTILQRRATTSFVPFVNAQAVQPSTCKTIPQRGSHQADTLPFWKKAPLGSSLRGSVASMTAFCAPSCAERGPRCEVMSVSQ